VLETLYRVYCGAEPPVQPGPTDGAAEAPGRTKKKKKKGKS
jgi:hypothetical protein